MDTWISNNWTTFKADGKDMRNWVWIPFNRDYFKLYVREQIKLNNSKKRSRKRKRNLNWELCLTQKANLRLTVWSTFALFSCKRTWKKKTLNFISYPKRYFVMHFSWCLRWTVRQWWGIHSITRATPRTRQHPPEEVKKDILVTSEAVRVRLLKYNKSNSIGPSLLSSIQKVLWLL